MQQYLDQLLADIAYARENVSWPFVESAVALQDWITDEEEDRIAPIRNLQEWTGIYEEMLPPENMLSGEQLHTLLEALKKLPDTYNCAFVLQMQVPERIQYTTIRHNFNQEVKVKRWHLGFFTLCSPGTMHGHCVLEKYCQCAFYKELFSGFVDEELTPEEERARALEMELRHIKRKYGDDWLRYYPYHLDKNYDKDGKPYDYGFEDGDDEDDDEWVCGSL